MSDVHVPDFFPEEWANHEPSDIPEGVEVPDYFDYIFAFRQWNISPSTGHLKSINSVEWPIKERLEARCSVYGQGSFFDHKGKNEYAAVSQFKILRSEETRSFIDKELWTAGSQSIDWFTKKRPIPIGSSMTAALVQAKTGVSTATNMKRDELLRRHREEPIPIEGCSCGIYATRTLQLLKEKAPWSEHTAFVGIVKLWGVGYEGSMGYRFQYGYPDRLFTRHSKYLHAGERYGVPVEIVKGYDDLFDRFGHIGR